jgi:lysophospholipase L1-like esterase
VDKLGRVFVVFFLAAAAAFVLFGKGIQAEQNTWTSRYPINIKIDARASYGLDKENTDCHTQTLNTLRLDSASAIKPTITAIDKCVLGTPAGTIGEGYLKPNSEYAYKVHAPGVKLVGIPNSPKYLQLYRDRGANTVSVLESFQANGKFGLENSNQYRGYVFRPAVTVPPFLKDKDGTWLKIKEFAFSGNGKWMIAESAGFGFVRINIETGQTIYFSDIHFSFWGGVKPALAISDDGKYAITSGRDAGGTYLHDISKCDNQSDFNLYNVDTSGCESKNLSAGIKNIDGDFAYLSGMRFSGNDRTITGTVLSSRSEPGFDKAKITLSLDEIPEDQTSYLAMGDSFASGEGDLNQAWYEAGTDEGDTNSCHLSQRSYPYLISRELQLDSFYSVACSGAKRENMLSKEQYPNSRMDTALGDFLPGRLAQNKYELGYNPSFITLSIGGNDLDFVSILTACLIPANTCEYADYRDKRAEIAKSIANEFDDLAGLYAQLADNTEHQTKIYVAGYPEFIKSSGGNCGLNVQFDDSERELVGYATRYANRVIKAAAEKAGVHYLDTEDALYNRNLCSEIPDSQMAVNGITFGDDIKAPWYAQYLGKLGGAGGSVLTHFGIGNESFHPNQNGHQLLSSSILALTDSDPARYQVCPAPQDKICPDAATAVPAPDPDYFGPVAEQYVNALNGQLSRDPEAVPEQKQILSELDTPYSVEVSLDGLEANSSVRAEIHSTPVVLGSFSADSSGSFDQALQIPKNTEPGLHEIHVYGTNFAGELVDHYQFVYVAGPEGDINSNGVPDDQENCGFVGDSGVDYDQDGTDDACDSHIGEPPQTTGDEASKNSFEQVIGNPPEDTSRADIIGGVNPTNNSSDFLIQNGGGLQSPLALNQGSSASGLQNNGSELFPSGNGIGQQDILGQSTVVGPVQFDAPEPQASSQAPTSGGGWVDPLVLLVLVVLAAGFAFGARRIIRS